MRRRTVGPVVGIAVLVGIAAGVGAHQLADPFPDDVSAGPTVASPSTAPSATSGATATPSASPPGSPSATPSGSPSASSSPSGRAAPAFTAQALLQPPEFVERGWAVARQVDGFDALPARPITPCTTIAADDPGVLAGYAATYASDRTSAAEVVARYGDEPDASSAYDRLRAAVAGCSDSSTAPDRVRITEAHHPEVAEVDELRWWTTRPLENGAARGVIGLVRVDDRIALVSLRSDVSDPAETTDVESLLTQAGLRLV